jgi:hypothetical protein
MHLKVLAVPDCPNAPVLKGRLAAVLGGRADVSVSHQMISDESEAARWGLHGSPTLLIDEADDAQLTPRAACAGAGPPAA